MGLRGENLYPPNTMPFAMQAVDELLEESTDFLNAYMNFTVPFLPGFKDRKNLTKRFLKDTFPKLLRKLETLHKKRGVHSLYLVTE